MEKSSLLLVALLLLAFAIPTKAQNITNAIDTAEGPLIVHPIQHGTLALEWKGQTVYIDPTGGTEAFANMDVPDLILITHLHGDHFKPQTLQAIDTEHAVIVAPASVAEEMNDSWVARQITLANSENTELNGINIRAIPMYNLPEEEARHPKGWGNGYVLTFADKKVYISGDTEGIPEMRSLENIDLDFICMNLPYTMDVEQAADAVLDFEPEIVYPYHYRGQDIQEFKELVKAQNTDIEVRLRDWYN